MDLKTERYQTQLQTWPTEGRHILAQFDDDSIIVYQAYRPAIGHFAAKHGYFGGDYSLNRMSWIKPNFLWMMYRSGWGTKPEQEITLAVRLKRAAFDEILSLTVFSSFQPSIYADHQDWQNQLKASSVRLQWDPDHDPKGNKQERRAIQLGLSGETLVKYSKEWVLNIFDLSDFVAEQRVLVEHGKLNELTMPQEDVYPVVDSTLMRRIGI